MLELNIAFDHMLTGSSFICDPPVTDTDIDYIVRVENLDWYKRYLVERGWTECANAEYKATHSVTASNFSAYRKDKYNIIATQNQVFFDRFRAATMLAKHLNLLDKGDRIKLFTSVIDGITNDRTD